MNLGDLKELGNNNETLENDVANFMEELSNALETKDTDLNLTEEKTGVVYGYKDEKITLLNIDDGKEFDVHIAISEDVRRALIEQGIQEENIFMMDKWDFYNIDLGTKIKICNGKCQVYNGEIEIKNQDAKYAIEELNNNIMEDEGENFLVKEIKDNKIYMTYEDGGWYFYTYQELYPDLLEGDKVKKVNGKYEKQ